MNKQNHLNNTDGKVLNNNFYLQNGKFKKFNNPNKKEEVAISNGVQTALQAYSVCKNDPYFSGFFIPDHYMGKQVYKRLVKLGVPAHLVSANGYEQLNGMN